MLPKSILSTALKLPSEELYLLPRITASDYTMLGMDISYMLRNVKVNAWDYMNCRRPDQA